MNDTTQDDPFGLPPLDSNQPPIELDPLPDIDTIVAYLEVNYSDVLARAREIIEKGSRHFVITNDAEDAAATEFMNSVRANWKTAEAGRLKEKAPYYERDGAIHAWFKTNILDPIGRAPDNAKERFDPLERTELGVGPRIMMAATIYKTKKLEAERKAREEEAQRARDAELAAQRRRQEEERVAREADDKRRREAAEAERKAKEESDRLAAEAARKRNAESRATAEAAAAEAKRKADEAAAASRAQEEKAAAERAERERVAVEEENRLAAERAGAELAASAKAADMTRARGGRGGVSSLKEFVSFRDVKREILDFNMLAAYFKEEHINMAIKAYADANKATVETHLRNKSQPIQGVVFFIDHKAGGRA